MAFLKEVPELTEELATIVADVQTETGYEYFPHEIADILAFTHRKCKMNGKDKSYIPILFKNELTDYLKRAVINIIGARNDVEKKNAIVFA